MHFSCSTELKIYASCSFLTIFELYRGGQFYLWRKPEYLEKTTNLPQAQHAMSGIPTLVAIGTDCIGTLYDYHDITQILLRMVLNTITLTL
jgi:hypothetical protein